MVLPSLCALISRALLANTSIKVLPMILRLASGSDSPATIEREQVFSIDTDDFDTHVFSEHLHHLIAFMQTQETIIDKHTSELIANGFVQ